jgi:hypothetical protein
VAGLAATVPPGHLIGFSPDGQRLVVAATGEVSVYSVGPAGVLTLSGSGPVGQDPRGVAFRLDGQVLAAAEARPSAVYSFAVSSGGALTALPASPAALPPELRAAGNGDERPGRATGDRQRQAGRRLWGRLLDLRPPRQGCGPAASRLLDFVSPSLRRR